MELIWLLKEIVEGRREEKKKAYILFLDVKKAYDTVWQKGLWKKLKKAGVPRWLVNLLRRWYSKAKATVSTPWGRTRIFSLYRGVKQGSVMSPWLYSMFINGLLKKLKQEKLGVVFVGEWAEALAFADDFVLVAESEDELDRRIRA